MKEVFDATLYGITRCADERAYTADKLCRKGRMEKRFTLLTVDMLSYLNFLDSLSSKVEDEGADTLCVPSCCL